MAIYVCDSIMGSGKSQAAITYMNAHPKDKFIYITPYLEEGKRIKAACPKLHFNLPTQMFDELDNSKIKHTMKLIAEGKNVATTHSAFSRYTRNMVNDIKRQGYTLIMDEAVNVFQELTESIVDIEMMTAAGYIKQCPDGKSYELGDRVYHGKAMRDAYELVKRNSLMKVGDDNDQLYYWEVYSDVLTAFKDVFVLTYLLEGQDIYYYMEANNIPYERIGVKKIDGTYTFVTTPGHLPEYTGRLSEMINIFEFGRLNSIGDGKYALSANWFADASDDDLTKLKRCIDGVYRNYRNSGEKYMWSVFKDKKTACYGPGYSKSYINCNERATNMYSDRTCLSYCVNIFTNPNKQIYLSAVTGLPYDNDMYGLSVMLQWIWRSAIRNGKPINIYVPSSRMRGLLKKWIADTEIAYANQDTDAEVKPL